jgi:hypothetical protein
MTAYPSLQRLAVKLAHLDETDAGLPFELLLRACRVRLQAPLRILVHLGAESPGRWQTLRASQQVGMRARDMLNLLYPRLGDGQIFAQQLELDNMYSNLMDFEKPSPGYLRLLLPLTHPTHVDLTTDKERSLLATVSSYGWDGLDVVGMLFLIAQEPRLEPWFGPLLEAALDTDPEVSMQLVELGEMSVETARAMTPEQAKLLAQARASLTPGNVLMDKDEFWRIYTARHMAV